MKKRKAPEIGSPKDVDRHLRAAVREAQESHLSAGRAIHISRNGKIVSIRRDRRTGKLIETSAALTRRRASHASTN